MTNSSEYSSYEHAKTRCENVNHNSYKDYGERGIEFKFNSFEEFYEEVGDKPEPKSNHSIDRIDSNGHYESGNVRWATKYQQARNTRDNYLITWNKETRCLSEWSKIVNIDRATLFHRINKFNYCLDCVFTNKKYEGCKHR